MPTYDYRCQACGCQFERFQQMSEEPLKKCPRCGGRLDRLVGTGAGVIFKGKGFHQNDYKAPTRTRCGAGRTCCGRDNPCATPPCDE